MLTEPTTDKLHAMRLHGMLAALEDQRRDPRSGELGFEDRFAMLVDRQYLESQQRACDARVKYAGLSPSGPCLEALDYRLDRAVSRTQIEALATPDWIRHGRNVLITGATGLGKSFIAEALARQACRNGFRTIFYYAPKFFRTLKTAELDGSLPRLLRRIQRAQLLVLDDFGMEQAKSADYRILLEILQDRAGSCSTLVTSQYAVDAWHDLIRSPTLADAVLDRLVHGAYRLQLAGDSVRKQINVTAEL